MSNWQPESSSYPIHNLPHPQPRSRRRSGAPSPSVSSGSFDLPRGPHPYYQEKFEEKKRRSSRSSKEFPPLHSELVIGGGRGHGPDDEGVVVEGLSSGEIGGDELVEWNVSDSDPEIRIFKSNLVATTGETNGLAYLWSGVRGSHGVVTGKHVVEFKVLPHAIQPRKPSPLQPRYVVRLGWSTLACRPYDLGFTNDSFGLENVGALWSNNTETPLHKSTQFDVDDIVTCLIDLEETYSVTYYRNGKRIDATFFIPSDLRGYAFFPHALLNNASVQVNFYPPSLGGYRYAAYTFLGNAPDYRVTLYRGPRPANPPEILVMCGLPWCGKTTWALKFARENQEKCYDIMGQDILLARLRRQFAKELAQQGQESAFSDALTSKARVVWKLLSEEVFPKSRRNYILDESAMLDAKRFGIVAHYEGFRKIGVLVVPSDDEWRKRRLSAAREGTTKFRSATVMDTFQRNYKPPAAELFDSFIYPELPQEAALSLLDAYRRRPVPCIEWSDRPFGVDLGPMEPIPEGTYPPYSHSVYPPPVSPGDHRKRKGEFYPTQREGSGFPPMTEYHRPLKKQTPQKLRPDQW